MAAGSSGVRESPDSDVFYSSDSDPGDLGHGPGHDLEQTVEKASDLLLCRDFDRCLVHCSEVIDRIRHTPSFQSYVDSLCIVTIQAFAELDQWDAVLPFVQRIYKNIDNCPVRIIQLCLLLHVKVKEYIKCHAIAKTWLQKDRNRQCPQYSDVVKLYVQRVLVPLGAYNLIPQLVDSCQGLGDAEKDAMLSPMRALHSDAGKTARGGITHSLAEPEEEKNITRQETRARRGFAHLELVKSLRRVSNKLLQWVGRLRLSPAWRLVFLVTLAALAFVNSFNSDMMTGYGRLMTMVTSATKLWSVTTSGKPG
ncbi:peroxisome assembly protein 26-like [Haliotis rubra]|uniref:peroxisome assembly protein 26-like n=1 Tax=Haliotis rubra TaxID=36100 RepID=UPI001EE5AA67|nr:peroxisome assembly protein 26-like [Haliotis rubra]